MRELQGLAASPGIAMGIVCTYSQGISSEVPHYGISDKQIANELKRLDYAFARIKESLKAKKEISKKVFGKQGEEIIEAHFSILEDPNLRGSIQERVEQEHINVEHAISEVFDTYIEGLVGQGNRLEELSHDVKAIRDDLLSVFLTDDSGFSCPIGERQPVIVATDRLDPSVILNMDTERVLAFISREGGYTSHATILARTRNIPIVFGIDVGKELDCRCELIVDGTLGKVFVEPDEKTKRFYEHKVEHHKVRKDECIKHIGEPATTADGVHITVKVNISTIGELELLKNSMHEEGKNSELYYDGIGLLRTEFLYMREKDPPSEEKQLSIYEEIVHAAEGKPVTVRVLDLTQDKLPSYITIPEGMNLNMEGRGARALQIFNDMYLTQVRALLRAAASGNIRILFPMVSDTHDLLLFQELIEQARSGLQKAGNEYRDPEVGIMFETPSSIMMAEELLAMVDFANLGTNDLLEYSIAASRADLRSQLMYHILHPSVVKMISLLAEKGETAGKEVCLCGEIASYEHYYPILLDTGLVSFSVPASKYEDIKCELLHINSTDILGSVDTYLKVDTREDQDELIESLYRKHQV